MHLRLTRRTTFVDEVTGDRYVGPGEFNVDDELAERYLDQRPGLWDRVDESGGQDSVDVASAVADAWQTLTSRIADGEFDDDLAALEAAERDRDGDPRDSVLEAIEERR